MGIIFHDFMTLLSLFLTPATIVGSIAVLVVWARLTFKAFRKDGKEAYEWLLIGVFFSFMGAAPDNLYWGVAWSMDFLGHPDRDQWFKSGVYSNVPFRQICTTIGAFCHVRAAVNADSVLFKALAFLSLAMGVIFTTLLVYYS